MKVRRSSETDRITGLRIARAAGLVKPSGRPGGGGGRGAGVHVRAMRVAVWICRPCDRGNIYCPPCAPVACRERVKRAGAQYQQSEPGRTNDKRRQQEYLARREARGKMTHRGSPGPSAAGHSPPRPEDEPRERARQRPHPIPSEPDRLRGACPSPEPCPARSTDSRALLAGSGRAGDWQGREGC